MLPDSYYKAISAKRRAEQPHRTMICDTCGMPVARDYGGWSHRLPPMGAAERRKYRHVVRPREDSPMTVLVSTSDLLGTAMTAARVAATELAMVRERTESSGQRALPLDRAVSELVQALAETLVAERYATALDSLTVREHDFGAQCDYITGLLNAVVNEARG